MFEYISSTKNQKQDNRGNISHTGWEHSTAELFEGQADSWEQVFFLCWKLTGTQVSKLNWYNTQSVLEW